MNKYERRMSLGNERWRGLVDWILSMDSIVDEIGCLPKMRNWFFTIPSLWWKLLLGPMTPFHFRLVGPGSDQGRAQDAERIIRKLPFGAVKEDNAFYMGIHGTIASLLAGVCHQTLLRVRILPPL